MTIQLKPHEIFLLEHYVSLNYFGKVRDAWEVMVKHVDVCLASFMQNLPPTYRAQSLPEQPDIVWGGRVLPNFRNTLEALNTGFILLSHGDVKGLTYAHGPGNDFKGQMDYWAGWMTKADEDRYNELLDEAVRLAHNVVVTEGGYWKSLSLTDYAHKHGLPNPPALWPDYSVNSSVRVRTGEKTTQSGIYVPDVASCAEFLSANYAQAPAAYVKIGSNPLLHPATGEKYDDEPVYEKRSCTWFLVERTAEVGLSIDQIAPEATNLGRVAAGEECPKKGFYFTPARPDSRRLFQRGEIMPNLGGGYGATIWQLDSDQT
jgi:hypothetical protein